VHIKSKIRISLFAESLLRFEFTFSNAKIAYHFWLQRRTFSPFLIGVNPEICSRVWKKTEILGDRLLDTL